MIDDSGMRRDDDDAAAVMVAGTALDAAIDDEIGDDTGGPSDDGPLETWRPRSGCGNPLQDFRACKFVAASKLPRDEDKKLVCGSPKQLANSW